MIIPVNSHNNQPFCTFPESRLNEQTDASVNQFVDCQMRWCFGDDAACRSISLEIARILECHRAQILKNLSVELEILCAKVAIECVPLTRDEELTGIETLSSGGMLKERCYHEISEAIVLELSHMCHLKQTHLSASFSVDKIIAVVEFYERSLHQNGFHWLGECLIQRVADLLNIPSGSVTDSDATLVTLLLASNGVVNYWEHEYGRHVRGFNLQSRLRQLAG